MVRGPSATVPDAMTRAFAALERFFERLFERPAARLFRTRLQPVQLQRRLERAMESDRRLSADRTYVPNRYRLLLNPADLASFGQYQSSLEADLGQALLQRARSRGYTLLERPVVTLAASGAVPVGDMEVRAELVDSLVGQDVVGRPGGGGPGGPGPRSGALPVPRATETAVFEIPQLRAPELLLEVRTPGMEPVRRNMRASIVRIGRARDNDLVLPDERVSRHHGQLMARHGSVVYTDMGSTNGSFLNGLGISEIAVGPGDILQLGDSTITVHSGRSQ